MKLNYSLRLEVFLSEIRRSPTVVSPNTIVRKIESLLQNGVEFINVSPNVADLPQVNANQHILVRPNTDVALCSGSRTSSR